MMSRSVLWTILLTLPLVFSERFHTFPSNQLHNVSRLFLRYISNGTTPGDFVVTWNSELKDGSFFYTINGLRSAAFYSITAKQRYLISKWPKGICTTEALNDTNLSPTERVLSSGKDFNIIQLITGDISFSVDSCSLKSSVGTCIASYICKFTDPSLGTSHVVVNSCTRSVAKVIVPLRLSGKKQMVEYTMLDNFDSWSDREWLSATANRDKLRLIDMYTVTPAGVYCEGRQSAKPVPKLPMYFSMYVDEVHYYEPDMRKTSYKVYDFKNHLVREDFVPDAKHNPKLHRFFGATMLQIVEDFNSGSRFVIDPRYDNCTILPLAPGLFDKPSKHSHVRMRYSYELFDSNKPCWQYSGRVHVRGLPAHRYICRRELGTHLPQASVETQELYYRPASGQNPILVQMRHTNIPVDKRLTAEFSDYTWHISNFLTDYTDHTLDAFDVSRCYSTTTKSQMELFAMMRGKLDELLKEQHIYVKVRNTLAEISNVSPQRISKLHFSEIGKEFIIVWFNLLGTPSAAQENSHYINLKATKLEEAFKLLHHTILQGRVAIEGLKTKYRILPHSLRTVQEREKEVCSKQYTSADMAALGLSFMGIGALGSAMAILCFQRRRRYQAVAYYVKT